SRTCAATSWSGDQAGLPPPRARTACAGEPVWLGRGLAKSGSGRASASRIPLRLALLEKRGEPLASFRRSAARSDAAGRLLGERVVDLMACDVAHQRLCVSD